MKISDRGRYQGVLQIIRFNWPMYAAAAAALMIGAIALALLTVPAALRIAGWFGLASAAFWLAGSLLVSHYVYDIFPLYRGDWIRRALPTAPTRYANLHVGFDETSNLLRSLFPASDGVVLDLYDAAEMTEASIARARSVATNQPSAVTANYRSLRLEDEKLDAAFLIFAAHELRTRGSRVQLLAEVRRVLRPTGRVVVVEHLRDWANFVAFGPGFLHFHSRAEWLHGFVAAGLSVKDEFTLTPFVRVFVLDRAEATECSNSLPPTAAVRRGAAA